MEVIKIGVISFAHMHAYSFSRALESLPSVEITGIYDDVPERGERAAGEFAATYYVTVEELLDSEIDAVVITSENVYHKRHVLAAARAKKHILCEKPLATNIEDAEEMIRQAAHHKVNLQTAFPVRFNSTIQDVKAFLEEDKLGEILGIKASNRGSHPGGWFADRTLAGGGAVLDHTVHLIDVMRWFMNTEVAEVYAEIGQLFSIEPIDDAGIITVEFANGAFATIDCSWSRTTSYPKGGDIKLEIVGTKGTLQVDAFGQNIHLYADEKGSVRRFWGDNMNLEMAKEFIASIREKRSPSVTGYDGLKAVEAALAAYQSAEKVAPVKLG